MAYFIPSENILLIWQYLLLYKKLTLNKAQQGKRNQTKTNKKPTNKQKTIFIKLCHPVKITLFFFPQTIVPNKWFASLDCAWRLSWSQFYVKGEEERGGQGAGEGRRKLTSVPLGLVSGNWPQGKGYVILEDLQCFLGKWLRKHPQIPKDRKDWNRRIFHKPRSTS